MNIQAEWNRISPNLPPIAYLLKQAYPDRWVRFHNLPNSKRYPETETEYKTIIDRNETVLFSLIDKQAELIAFAPKYDDENTDQPSFSEFNRLIAEPAHFGSVTSELDSEISLNIYFAKFLTKHLPTLIRLVADEVLSNIILADFSAGILYHPYDGGMDFILENKAKRDSLKARFSEWYPGSTSGL